MKDGDIEVTEEKLHEGAKLEEMIKYLEKDITEIKIGIAKILISLSVFERTLIKGNIVTSEELQGLSLEIQEELLKKPN